MHGWIGSTDFSDHNDGGYDDVHLTLEIRC